MQRVVILGAGGFAREVLDIFHALNSVEAAYQVLGFVDENPTRKGAVLNGSPVLGGFDAVPLADRGQIQAICGVGDPAARSRLVQKAADQGLQFCNVVHPTAVLTPFVSLGTGVVITAGCILTNQITIGDHVHLNLDCTIGHDCIIDDFVTIAPGAHTSGDVHIGTGCDIGTGTAIIQGVTVGEWSVTGAGSVIVDDVPPNVTVVGVPAKVIKQREPGWHLKKWESECSPARKPGRGSHITSSL
jgi:sugar O-acyltransferase (sialic acid O-acetyltransferase NeuD family)